MRRRRLTLLPALRGLWSVARAGLAHGGVHGIRVNDSSDTGSVTRGQMAVIAVKAFQIP